MKTFTIYFSEKNVWKMDIQANTAKEAEQKMFDFWSSDEENPDVEPDYNAKTSQELDDEQREIYRTLK
jgi:hypothetical protein